MADSNISLLAGIEARMSHIASRQRVVAQNIANSDTPGFRAREVEGPDFSAMLASTTGSAGSSRVGRPQVVPTARMADLGTSVTAGTNIVEDQNSSETKPDGNNVVLEEQMLKLGQMQADFASLTNIYRKQMDLLQRAAGGGGR